MDSDALKCKSVFIKKCEKSGVNTLSGYVSLDEENSDHGEDSDELFSDNDDKKKLGYYTPNVSHVTECSSLNLSETSLLHTNSQLTTPNTAVVPSTPLGLLPFLTRTNEQWTSDLETPQTDKTAPQYMDRITESGDKNNSLKQCTPNVTARNHENECVSTSPVLTTKRVRKRPKRRIFKSCISVESASTQSKDDVNQTEGNTCKTINVALQQNTLNTNNSNVLDHLSESNRSEAPYINTNEHVDLKIKENSNTVPDSHNTSSQNFFNNASFGSIDKICLEDFGEHGVTTCKFNSNDITKDRAKSVKNNEICSIDSIKIEKSNKAVDSHCIGNSTTINRIIDTKSKILKRTTRSDPTQQSHLSPPCTLPSGKQTLLNGSHMLSKSNSWSDVPIVNKNTRLLMSTIDTNSVNFATACEKNHYDSKTSTSEAQSLFSKNSDKKYLNNNERSTMQFFESTNKKSYPDRVKNCSNSISDVEKQFIEKPMDNLLKTSAYVFEDGVAKVSKEIRVEDTVANCNIPLPSFSTASGRLLNVSEKALSKARSLFQDQLDFVDQSSENTENNTNLPEIFNERDTSTNCRKPSFSFTTAGGRLLNVSEKALSKARLLFADQLDSIDQSSEKTETNKHLETFNETDATRDCHKPSFLFSTASGRRLNVSEKALSKARSLFADQIDVTDQPLEKIEVGEKLNEKDITTNRNKPTSCFLTASGRQLHVSEKAQSKADQIDVTNQPSEMIETNKDFETFSAKNIMQNVYKPSSSFLTASGRHLNVSEKALSKARSLFADQFDATDKSSETLEINKNFPETLNEKDRNKSSSCFSTASGRQLFVSEKALLKAQSFLADQIDVTYQSSEMIEANKDFETFSERNITKNDCVPSSLFSTASGRQLNVSEKALSKAQTLFADQFDGTDRSLEKIEIRKNFPETFNGKDVTTNRNKSSSYFSTASVRSGNVPEQVLSKTGLLSADQFNSTERPSNNTESNKTVSEAKQRIPTFSFSTASGRSVKVSEKALLKAQELFTDCFTDESPLSQIPETHLSKQNLHENKENLTSACNTKTEKEDNSICRMECSNYPSFEKNGSETSSRKIILDEKRKNVDPQCSFTASSTASNVEINIKIPSVSFKTSNCKPVKFSDKTQGKVHQILSDDTDDMHVSKNLYTNNKEIDEPVVQMSNIGFQTARGQRVNISKEALLKANILLSKEITTDFENSFVMSQSFQKRKNRDTDNTHVDVYGDPQFKKLRFTDELQPTKSFSESITNTSKRKEENEIVSLKGREASTSESKQLFDPSNLNKIDNESQKLDYNSLISKEIIESAVALLVDETKSVDTEQQNSPIKSNGEENTQEIPSSPVIGRQSTSRKRKNIRKRKKDVNIPNDNNSGTIMISKNRSSSGFVEIVEGQETITSSSMMYKTYEKDVSCDNVNSMIPQHEATKKHKQSLEEKITGEPEKKCDNANSNEYGDTQLMLDFINEAADIVQKRLTSALEQEKLINMKKKNKVKPITGTLFSYKNSNHNRRISWRELSNGNPPVLRTYEELISQKLLPEILDITPVTASTYRFRCTDFYGQDVQSNTDGINVGDGTVLILDENGYVGISEIKRSFLASPGVDPNLLPPEWIENHYRWIVWKLASIDRMKFGSVSLPRVLTPSEVMAQLKYRYDREIDRSQRSALRKILEKDDVPSKRMVLCVSSIIEHQGVVNTNTSPKTLDTSLKKLILTDGWYCISTFVDQAMIKNIASGKVKEGMKLITYGAELLNCDQGCSPLEVPDSVSLKIHTNSTRRARWDTKLGYVAPPGPMRVKLRNIFPNGGLVGKIVVSVARVYPMLYHEKTSNGESIFRNARCEEKANIAYEEECRSKAEAFYAKAEKYFFSGRQSHSAETDSIDLAAVEWTEDCEKLSTTEFRSKQEQEQLLNECRVKGEEFRQKLQSKLRESLPAPRKVTTLLKLRVTDGDTNAILSVWSPNEEIVNILKEGNCISICNINASGKRGGELQLSLGRNALFNPTSACNINYPYRTYTSLYDTTKPTFTPAYGEFDTVGIVVFISNGPYGMKNFEAVHLAYPRTDTSQSSYLSVLFWNSIAGHGYTEILTVGSLVACSNLEWRRATSRNIPIAYCTERSIFTRNPRQRHLLQPFDDLNASVTDKTAYVNKCAIEILEELQKKSLSRMDDQSTPDRSSSGKILANEISSVEKQFLNTTPYESSSRNLMSSSSQMTRNAAIQRRLDKLQCYGDGPKLSPIVLNSSKRVMLDFRSPIQSQNVKPTNCNSHLSKKLAYDSE